MFHLSFIHPVMLFLLVLLAGIWALALATPRRLTPGRFYASLVLRSAIFSALVLALAGTQLVRPVSQLTTVFLLDASDSLSPSARAQAETFLRDALGQMPDEDKAALVVFGGNALVERAPSDNTQLGRIASLPVASSTNIEDAIQLGLALFPDDTHKRLVLLSDGAQTDGDAPTAARIAAARDVPIDVVNLALPSNAAEVLVSDLSAPARVRDGQDVTLDATLSSTTDQTVTVRLLAEQAIIAEQSVDLKAGTTRLRFTAPATGSGFVRYSLQVDAAEDQRVQNNVAAALVQIAGPPRVLLVAAAQDDVAALRAALQATNVDAEVVAPAQMPRDLAGLSVYEAVVLVNVPARDVPVGAMAALPGYVRDLGKGLLMIGGNASYGVGGYGNTPVEEALPVWMDVRDREERPDVALAFVIDKSGSMDSCHCSGPNRTTAELSQGGERKVDIAKEAVAQAANLLGPRDTIGIVSFDDNATLTLPATQGASVDEVVAAVSNVEPRGSTNVRSGLLAAEDMLDGVNARIKHIVLLTDGWGGGGDHLDIAARMREKGMTLTVVAAGGGSADYLERLANAGGGRYYPALQMEEVPQIFVQETITTVGTYLIEQPTVPIAVGESPILSGLPGLPTLYGYNGSTLKDTASTVLQAPDDAPLLATWQFGLGRSAAWLSDANGTWAKDWVRWNQFPRFAGQLVSWVLPTQGSTGVSTEVRALGDTTEVRLRMDENTPVGATMEVSATLLGGDGSREVVAMRQVAPGEFVGRVDSPPPGTYLVQVSGAEDNRAVVQELAGLVVPYAAEYRANQADTVLLDELASETKGALIDTPEAAWSPLAGRVVTAQEIGLPLLLLALLLLPFDIGVRRVMLRRSDFADARGWLAKRTPQGQTRAAPSAQDATLSRLSQAKQRTKPQQPAPPSGQNTPPAPKQAAPPQPSTPPPAPPPATNDGNADQLTRLRAAKERARRRARGEE